jgi:hypothetical protein
MEGGGRRRARNALSFAGTFLLSLGILWVALRQDLSAAVDFASASFALISTYSAAMVREVASEPNDQVLVALAVVATGIAAALLGGRGLVLGRRVGLLLIAAIALFALWKQTFVRFDPGRDPYLFTGALAVILALRWRAQDRVVAATAVGALIGMTFLMSGFRFDDKVRPVAAVEGIVDDTRTVFDTDRRGQFLDFSQAIRRGAYGVDARALEPPPRDLRLRAHQPARSGARVTGADPAGRPGSRFPEAVCHLARRSQRQLQPGRRVLELAGRARNRVLHHGRRAWAEGVSGGAVGRREPAADAGALTSCG